MSTTSRNDALTSATAGRSDAEHLVKLDTLSRQLEIENFDLAWCVKGFLEHLPSNLPWPNPDLINMARGVINSRNQKL